MTATRILKQQTNWQQTKNFKRTFQFQSSNATNTVLLIGWLDVGTSAANHFSTSVPADTALLSSLCLFNFLLLIWLDAPADELRLPAHQQYAGRWQKCVLTAFNSKD